MYSKILLICFFIIFLFTSSYSQEMGQRFPSENSTITDDETGIQIIVLTASHHKDQKMYQTHPQWTSDGKYIIYRSDRADEGEGMHAYAISMENYEIVRITAGNGEAGLHLSRKENAAYFFRDNQLIKLDLGSLLADSEQGEVKEVPSYERIIATLPDGIRFSGYFGLDADESRIFFRHRIEDGSSELHSLDFETGNLTKLAEVPFHANHIQANPWVPGEIMYCWETGGDAPQRMWYLKIHEDGKVENNPIYKETPDEWVTHETFMGPDHILFNVAGHQPGLRKKPTGIFSLNIRTNEVLVHDQVDGNGYWHSNGTSDLKWAVGDVTDGRIYRLNLENGKRTLLTSGHRPKKPGDHYHSGAHAHQSISPDGKWVLFNSSLLSESDLMMIRLHPKEL